MSRYIEQVFENRKVDLDNNEYERCTFTNCTFRYSGAPHFVIDDGRMDGCTVEFGGPAANTLTALSKLIDTPLRDSVKKQLSAKLTALLKEQS